MMEFLRGLAPRRAADATRASAVLPSRFAIGGPLSAVPAVPLSTVATGDEWPAQTASEPRPQAAVQPVVDPFAGARAPATAHVDASASTRTVVESRPADGPTTRVAPRTSRDDRGQWAPPSLPLAQPRALDSTRKAPLTVSEPVVAQRSAGVALAATPPVVIGSSGAQSTERAAPPLPVPAVAAPMSDAALAARTSSRADQRPVIHVTIDRIDVRAPASPRQPALPARSRAASPRVSLSDYLRGGTRRPGDAP